MLSPELSPYLNTQEGLARIRGNQSVYKSLLLSFLKKDYLEQLATEIAQGDTEIAARTAHSVKGTSGNLSMPMLYQISIDLEHRLKAGECVRERLEEFRDIAQKTQQAVTATLDAIDRGEEL